MIYFDRIKELTKNVPVELVYFSQPRDIARIPTQASSNFITNKEQVIGQKILLHTLLIKRPKTMSLSNMENRMI